MGYPSSPVWKTRMDRGLSLRTYLWLTGSLFILAASLSFVAYLRFAWPWWSLVVMLGLSVAVVVETLEHALRGPAGLLVDAIQP